MPPELWPAEGKRQWRLITDTVMGGVSRGTPSDARSPSIWWLRGWHFID